jgi:hypothetical protein
MNLDIGRIPIHRLPANVYIKQCVCVYCTWNVECEYNFIEALLTDTVEVTSQPDTALHEPSQPGRLNSCDCKVNRLSFLKTKEKSAYEFSILSVCV